MPTKSSRPPSSPSPRSSSSLTTPRRRPTTGRSPRSSPRATSDRSISGASCREAPSITAAWPGSDTRTWCETYTGARCCPRISALSSPKFSSSSRNAFQKTSSAMPSASGSSATGSQASTFIRSWTSGTCRRRWRDCRPPDGRSSVRLRCDARPDVGLEQALGVRTAERSHVIGDAEGDGAACRRVGRGQVDLPGDPFERCRHRLEAGRVVQLLEDLDDHLELTARRLGRLACCRQIQGKEGQSLFPGPDTVLEHHHIDGGGLEQARPERAEGSRRALRIGEPGDGDGGLWLQGSHAHGESTKVLEQGRPRSRVSPGRILDLLGDVPAPERSVALDEWDEVPGHGLRARLQTPKVNHDRRRVTLHLGPESRVVREPGAHRHAELIRECEDRLERRLSHLRVSGGRIERHVVVHRPLDDDLQGAKLSEISEEPPPRVLAP